MATWDDMWSRFTLSEEEVHGADVPSNKDESVHRLADLERVLEFEPWSYDKSLVIFQRTESVESAPSLDFSVTSFWVQLHNVPEKSLTQETGAAVGNIIGSTIRVADPEDDGEGCEYLRVRVAMNITKPLPRCCKLKSEGKHIGWALLKFERLPNFCYWCGRVNHTEKDCETWLKDREKLGKEDQQFGEWMRADQFKPVRKSVIVIAGSSRGSSRWKKGPSMPKDPAVDPNVMSPSSPTNFSDVIVEAEPSVEHVVAIPSSAFACGGSILRQEKEKVIEGLSEGVAKLGHEAQKVAHQSNVHTDLKQGDGKPIRKKGELGTQSARNPLQDLSNFQTNQPEQATIRTWKKLAREVNPQ
ncbi:uncharacterized protein CFP56_015975 [Quercus suber]|uniref:CCHC-type domain-containing protein n=1 Tax=Quercus suber TaxID=58331 RepID=A0AAW0KR40_QUESU